MVIEIMGNKVGWLTLYTGVAGGADVVLIPEIPYDIKKVVKAVERRAAGGHGFSIVCVAEGAFDVEEARLKKKERSERRALCARSRKPAALRRAWLFRATLSAAARLRRMTACLLHSSASMRLIWSVVGFLVLP